MENLATNQQKIKVKRKASAKTSLITKSFLFAGIGFVLIALIGFGFGQLITKSKDWWDLSNNINILWAVSVILIIVSMVLSMITLRKIEQASVFSILGCMLLYVVGEGAGFGIIFGIYDISFIMFVFGFGGAVFLVTALIGLVLPEKATASLGKFIGIVSMALMFVLLFTMMFGLMFWFIPGWNSFAGMQWWYFIIYGVMAILMSAYIVYDVSVITKSAVFIDMKDQPIANNYALFFGYKLLIDLIGLIWTLIMLLGIIRN